MAVATLPDLASLTDEELAALCAGADEATVNAVIAEGERRDEAARSEKRQQAARAKIAARREALKADYWTWVHAEFLAAEERCCGNLLSAEGKKHTDEPMSLWQRPESIARRWASWELNAWWDDPNHPHMTFTQFMRQRAMSARVDRQERERETMDEAPAGLSAADIAARAQRREAQHLAGLSPQRQAEVSQRRQAARSAQLATRGTEAIEPTTVHTPARRQRPDAPALLRRVLEETGLYLCEYVQFPSRSAVVAVLMWIAHAAARGEDGVLLSRTSPRLLLTSAKNGSGKSTLLDLIGYLLHSRTGRMVKVTAAGLAKVLGQYHDVALPDDAQLTFGSTGTASKEIQAVLLGGYTRKGSWVTGEKSGGIKNVFGPAAVAGKDQLITTQAEALADFLARSWIIRMERPKRYMPQPDEDAEEKGEMLGKALAAVMTAVADEYRQAMRDLAREAAGQDITEGDGGRTAQIWRIGEAIARVAGGPWPAAMADAAEELTAAAGDLLAAEDAVTTAAQSRTDDRDFWSQIEDLTQ